ncbi:unnamed protein product [Pseudo-nitzschia multistriata]|uniref:Uncharacterized protein n=1 Tax=Pseudo-nitzschia multistriata TaxID=183589 RepID=A0A448ZEI6_9STRA|nr:unnamed protein product [Pseudo-nitzschia multistriata]
MVIVNDLEVLIVSAEDENNTPFKEHRKGTNTYVEAEPDAEYFISIRKFRTSATGLYCKLYVDGKDLEYYLDWGAHHIDSSPEMHGIWSYSKGVSTDKALQFVKASSVSGDAAMATMGEIRMEVYERINHGIQRSSREVQPSSTFKTAPSIPLDCCNSVTNKKNIRTKEGHREITKLVGTGPSTCSSKGAHLYSIPLYYCAAPGLIAVGVLPKPPLWDLERTINPAQITPAEKKELEKLVLSVKRDRKGNEIIELREEDEDEDDPGCCSSGRDINEETPDVCTNAHKIATDLLKRPRLSVTRRDIPVEVVYLSNQNRRNIEKDDERAVF